MTDAINVSGFPGSALNHKVTTRTDAAAPEHVFILTRENGVVKVPGSGFAPNNQRSVRRPIGLEFKKDTYSFIEVVRQEGDELIPISVLNENFPERQLEGGITDGTIGGQGPESFVGKNARREAQQFSGTEFEQYTQASWAPYTNNFLVQQANETREEKFQLLETFGDNFVFFFGERPRFFDVQGLLLNSNSHRWKREWWLNYDNFLRGSKAVENKAIVTLHVDNVAISGYILNCQATEVAMNPRQLQFSFRMLVTDYVFEDEDSGNTVSFFGNNLRKNNDVFSEGAAGVAGAGDLASKVSDMTQAAFGGIDKILGNAIAENAVKVVTQAVFGNPFGAVTEGIASAVNLARTLKNNNIESIFDVPFLSGDGLGVETSFFGETTGNLTEKGAFAAGFGSFVEFQGKPPELLPIKGSEKTLGEIGTSNLLASVDNSLSILLNLQRSPVIQSVSMLGGLIERFLQLAGANTSAFSNARGEYNKALDRAGKPVSGGYISGRYMGYDFTMPFTGLKIATINPERERIVNDDIGEATSSSGDPQRFNTSTLEYVTNSPTIDFAAMKASNPTVFQNLPRQWRLLIEKDPLNASRKIIATSRSKSDGTLQLELRETKETRDIESTLSRRVEKILEG